MQTFQQTFQHAFKILQIRCLSDMGKKKASRCVHGEPTGKGIMEHPLIDLNVLPANVPKVDSTKQPEDDLPPPPRLCVSLSFTNVDSEVLRHTYKCVDSSPVVGNEHLRNLGFLEGETDTFMCTRDKKTQFPKKSFRALARSWLKEVSTKKNQVIDQGASTDKTMKENGDEEAKKYSPEHTEQVKAPKASARMARKKRAKIPKQVCALSAPRSGKNKSAPKTVCCISPLLSGKEKSEPKAKSLYDILEAIELLHGI